MSYRKSIEELMPIARAAVAIEREKGYPADLVLAQHAVESAWGDVPSGKNNLFGLAYFPELHKGHPYSWATTFEFLDDAGIQALDPEEAKRIVSVGSPNAKGKKKVILQRRFLDFPTVRAAIEHKADMIMHGPRYSEAYAQYVLDKDMPELIRGIAAAGYATAPDYRDKLLLIIKQGNIQGAVVKARSEAANV